MVSIDATGAGPLTIFLLVVLTLVVTALSEPLGSAWWRRSVARDIALYDALEKAARNDSDHAVAESVRRAAFRRASVALARPRRVTGAIASFLTAHVGLAASAALILVLLLIGWAGTGKLYLVPGSVAAVVLAGLVLDVCAYAEKMIALREREHRDAQHVEHGSPEEPNEREQDKTQGDSQR